MPEFKDPKTEYIHTSISLKALAEKWQGTKGCSLSVLAHRAADERWSELRHRFNIRTAIKTDERLSESIAEMNKRNLAQALFLQDKAGAALNELNFKSASEAANALKESQVMLERAKKGGVDIRHMIEIRHTNGNGEEPKDEADI